MILFQNFVVRPSSQPNTLALSVKLGPQQAGGRRNPAHLQANYSFRHDSAHLYKQIIVSALTWTALTCT